METGLRHRRIRIADRNQGCSAFPCVEFRPDGIGSGGAVCSYFELADRRFSALELLYGTLTAAGNPEILRQGNGKRPGDIGNFMVEYREGQFELISGSHGAGGGCHDRDLVPQNEFTRYGTDLVAGRGDGHDPQRSGMFRQFDIRFDSAVFIRSDCIQDDNCRFFHIKAVGIFQRRCSVCGTHFLVSADSAVPADPEIGENGVEDVAETVGTAVVSIEKAEDVRHLIVGQR